MKSLLHAVYAVALFPLSAAVAQDSLCDPCVDPPLDRPAVLEPMPIPQQKVDSGIDELRGYEKFFGTRTLRLVNNRRTDQAGPEAADEGGADRAAADGGDKSDAEEVVADESDEP